MTSGIERHVLLHSPKSFSPSCQGLIPTSTDVRSLPQRNSEDRRRFIRALARTLAEGPEQSESEDELQTIALFDQYAFTGFKYVVIYVHGSITAEFFDKREELIRFLCDSLRQTRTKKKPARLTSNRGSMSPRMRLLVSMRLICTVPTSCIFHELCQDKL